MRRITAVVLLLLVFAMPLASATTTTMSITAELNPRLVIIGVKDTSIAFNSTLVMNSLPGTVGGIFIMTGVNNSPEFINTVQKFIDDYKKKYPDNVVLQYYFYYKSNTTVYKPHLYKNVDYVVVSPMSVGELLNYTKMLAGKKIVVVLNYMVFTTHSKDNRTTQNIKRLISIETLIRLYKEGKIYGVAFPFYQVEKDGSEALLETMKEDARELRVNNLAVVGIVQPYINFFTGSVDLPRTIGAIITSNKVIGGTIYLSWENMPVPLLAYLDPFKFQKCHSSFSIDWSKAGIYLGMVPALVIIVIFVAVIVKRRKGKKKAKKDSKDGKTDEKSGEKKEE